MPFSQIYLSLSRPGFTHSTGPKDAKHRRKMFRKLLPLVAQDRTDNADNAHKTRMEKVAKDNGGEVDDADESDSGDDIGIDKKMFM